MPIDPFEHLPGYLLRRVSAASMERLSGRLRKLGLRPSEATVLCVVRANPNITQSDLGRMLNIARANMAPLAGRLARIGLLERRPVDGRSHGLALTAKGQAMTLRIVRAIEQHESELAARIPAGQLAAFVSCLRALRDS